MTQAPQNSTSCRKSTLTSGDQGRFDCEDVCHITRCRSHTAPNCAGGQYTSAGRWWALPRTRKNFPFCLANVLFFSWRQAFAEGVGWGDKATRGGNRTANDPVRGGWKEGVDSWDLVGSFRFLCLFLYVLGPLEGNIPVCRAFDFGEWFSLFFASRTFFFFWYSVDFSSFI